MSAINALRLKVFHVLAIDRAVFFSIVGKIWTLPAGLITTLLIASVFSPELQGYYYTFSSVLALGAFAELGLGVVLINYASHEWAKLALDEDGRVIGDADALSRLTSLGQFAATWYLIAAAIMTLVLTVGGLVFFATAGDPAFPWRAPWIVLCVVTGLTLCLVPVWALLEGCNQVSNVYTYRLIQSVAFSIAAWAAIYLDAGLWTASISGTASLIATIVMIGPRYGQFIRTIMLRQPKGPHLRWRMDILPMQWRIALSWVSGYFTFALFNPVLFHYQGPVVAGQMGMTWAITTVLMAVAHSWVAPKAPTFGILIAQKKYIQLDRLFWRIIAVVFGVTAIGALAIWALVFVLNQLHHPFAARMLSPVATGYFALATFLVAVSLPMSIYLRAHKKEPLLALSILSGILNGITIVALGKYYGADGVAIGYLVVTAIVIPLVALTWYRKRAEWHADIESVSPLQTAK